MITDLMLQQYYDPNFPEAQAEDKKHGYQAYLDNEPYSPNEDYHWRLGWEEAKQDHVVNVHKKEWLT